MEIKVGQEIRDLLLEHGQLALPSLGTFVGEYQSALLDQLQGVLSPPQYRLRFDTGLLLDDGLLTQHLREKYDLSVSEARFQMENFVSECRLAFESRELVLLSGVGRLYLDSSHCIQFLSDATNFNPETFGLPTVRLVPVTRTKSEIATPQTTIQPEVTPQKSDEKPAAQVVLEQVLEKKQSQNKGMPLFETMFKGETVAQGVPTLMPMLEDNLPATTAAPKVVDPVETELPVEQARAPDIGLFTPTLVVLVILLLAFLFMHLNEAKKPMPIPSPSIEEVPPRLENTNQPPPIPPPVNNNPSHTELPDLPSENESESPVTFEKNINDDKKSNKNNKKTTLAVKEKLAECIVIVGAFSDPVNAHRTEKNVQALGYTVYRDKTDGTTRIGCRFAYESDKELERRVAAIRKRFGATARILKK